jgi:4-carboxymuconolactone decarboxylase
MTDTEPRIPPLPRGTLPDDVRVALQGWLRPDATEVPVPLDISESTWEELAAGLDERQLMDLVFTVGAYALSAMAFNAFGLRSDPGSE